MKTIWMLASICLLILVGVVSNTYLNPKSPVINTLDTSDINIVASSALQSREFPITDYDKLVSSIGFDFPVIIL